MGKAKSAELLIQLYDLRREATMREARNWIGTFFPKSAEDVANTMMDPEVGGYLRMVISYWDMAASFVNHGAIDAQMFDDANGEHLFVFCKIRPFLPELRTMFETDNYLAHLEKLILDLPDGEERIEKMDRWMEDFEAKMGEKASGQAG
ncbi:MAG TPA: hypothetical protein VMM38_02920 [Aridibacter sp.]|nr:hypothetical protein [Aridibacter sp.]